MITINMIPRKTSIFASILFTNMISLVASENISSLVDVRTVSCNSNDMEECFCPCDVSVGACDSFCCCDLDCSPTDISSLSHDCRGIDIKASSNRNEIIRNLGEKNEEKKISKRQLSSAKLNCSENRRRIVVAYDNHRFDFQRLSDFVEDKMEQLLCLHYDNSAVRGEYFTHDTDKLTPAVEHITKKNDFSFGYQGNQYDSMDFELSPYNEGDYIATKIETQTSTGTLSEYSRESKLSLPGVGDGGFCSFDNAVQFGKSFISSCWIVIDDLEKNCYQSLDIDKFVNNISVQKMKGDTLDLNEDPFLSIKVESISSKNGEKMSNLKAPFTVWNNDTKSCTHSLKDLKYDILHISNEITEVKATITWTNITFDTKFLEQNFEVSFISVSKDASSGDNSGYLFHSPTLAGTLDKVRVNLSNKGGLTLMNAGSCIKQNKTMHVGFGAEMSIACTVEMNKHDLQNFCVSLNHEYLERSGLDGQIYIPSWLNQENDMIGIYMDADPNNLEAWVPIISDIDKVDYVGKSRVWNPYKNKCDGMITAVHYQIFWTYSGQLENPQARILRVTKDHYGGTPLIHSYHDDVKQNFRFTSSLSWIYIEPKKEVKSLSIPTLFSVPNDVFYPFQKTSSQGKILPSLLVVVVCSFASYTF